MKQRTVFARLVTSFSIVLVLLILVGAIGLVGNVQLNKNAEKVYKYNILKLEYLCEMSNAYYNACIYVNKVTIATLGDNIEDFNISKTSLLYEYELIETAQIGFENSIRTQEDKDLYNIFSKAYNEFKTIVNKLVDADEKAILTNGSDAEGLSLLNEAVKVRMIVDTAVAELLADNATDIQQTNKDGKNLSLFLVILQSVITLIGIAGIFVIIIVVNKNIERDLNVVVTKLKSSSRIIGGATAQLSEASDSLANGSSRQAAAIEETSATMNETASMITQNAENTRHAAQLAEKSKDNASKGTSKMSIMVNSMEELKESSDKIGKIVKVIDDIAFQTNLLAINATVEAARAGGDAGRSFAVVADEVRNLAQRSANAAADTTLIIEKNITLTNSSREVSKDVAETLGVITEEFENLSKIIDEINAASEEQASGIKQINIAMSQMEKVTQQNAAVAEENAATSSSMTEEVDNLNTAVSYAESLLKNKATNNNNSNNDNSSNYSSAIKTPKLSSSSSSSSSYKPLPSNSNTKSTKSMSNSDAEKIIPLDSEDDF